MFNDDILWWPREWTVHTANDSLTFRCYGLLSRTPRSMQVIETNDPVEAQRCRRVQYVGIPTAVTLGGSKFVGLVQSVKQEVGPRWIVTIIPKQPKVFALARYRPYQF